MGCQKHLGFPRIPWDSLRFPGVPKRAPGPLSNLPWGPFESALGPPECALAPFEPAGHPKQVPRGARAPPCGAPGIQWIPGGQVQGSPRQTQRGPGGRAEGSKQTGVGQMGILLNGVWHTPLRKNPICPTAVCLEPLRAPPWRHLRDSLHSRGPARRPREPPGRFKRAPGRCKAPPGRSKKGPWQIRRGPRAPLNLPWGSPGIPKAS